MSYLHMMLKISEGFHTLIWANFFLLNGIILWKYFTRLLFGELRLIEYEHILERISYTILNLIIISSMFKEGDLIIAFAYNCVFVFCKVLHWIIRDRMDFIFQVDNNHANLMKLLLSKFTFNLALLFIIDLNLLKFCYDNSSNPYRTNTISIHTMFTVQFGMLLLDLMKVLALTSLNLYEIYIVRKNAISRTVNQRSSDDNGNDSEENPYEELDDDEEEEEITSLEGKFIYDKMIDITVGALKMILQLVCLRPLEMPISFLASFFWEGLGIFQSARMLWKSWKNSKKLDISLVDATDNQIETKEIDICIVCMDDFVPSHMRKNNAKKPKILPCGHALHLSCLKNWIERSPTCPMCRLPIFDSRGNILPQQSTSQAAQTDSQDEMVNEQQSEQHNELRLASNSDVNEYISETSSRVDFSSVSNSEDSWMTLPVTTTHRGKNNFKLVTESGRELEGSIILKRNINDSQAAIILPSDTLNEDESLTLKRKIADLENRLDELSKKIRTD